MFAPYRRFLAMSLLIVFAASCSQLPVPPIKMPSIKVPTLQGGNAKDGDSADTPAVSQDAIEIATESTRPRTIDPAARKLFEESLNKIEQDDLAAARLLLTELTSLHPDFPAAHHNLGQVLEQLGEQALATIAYQAAVQTDPGFCPAQIRLGLLARTEYRFEDSETAYRQCVTGHPENAIAHYNLGVLYEIYLGRYADAVASYEQFQSQQDERDRMVDLWINDLKRRMPAPAPNEDASATVKTTDTPPGDEVNNDQT